MATKDFSPQLSSCSLAEETPCSEGTGCSCGSEAGLGDGNGLLLLYKHGFLPRAREGGLQSCFLFANSISIEGDGFAQGLQSAPERQNGMGAFLLLAATELIRSILVYLKVFWAPNHWKSIWSTWFVRPRCPCADKTQPLWHRSPAALASILSSREELCNTLIAVGLKMQQRLPRDANAVAGVTSPWSYLRVSKFSLTS